MSPKPKGRRKDVKVVKLKEGQIAVVICKRRRRRP